MDNIAVIVAAGRGSRAGEGLPKQYRAVGGETVLRRSVGRFLAHPGIDGVVCAIHPDDRELYDESIADLPDAAKLRPPALGGATRQGSVHNALETVAASGMKPRLGLIHDAARSFVTPDLISRAVVAGEAHGAAIPAVAVTDTVKRVSAEGRVLETLDRSVLRTVQTPQVFLFDAILAAHRKAAAERRDDFTDDASLAEWAGLDVHLFPGEAENVKLTKPADFEEAERRLGAERPPLLTRLATGFDVHVFGPGDHVWLGGLRVPHDRGVVAHSDGDVVLHALTDAVLGTLADGDIGTHFPPSDPQWRGASSDRFLAFAAERVREAGGIVDHLDATILCERPKVGPYRDAMRARIAEIAGIGIGAVSIKATTTERLGFTGRGEGLAAQAAATVRLPAGR